MSLANAAKNLMLDALGGTNPSAPITHVSTHTDYSSTGTNEVTGGSPAYARKAATWAAASGGSKAASNAPVFDIPPSTTIRWLGFWSAVTAGTFHGMVPLGGAALKPFNVDDAATDTLDSKAHGFTDTQTVVVWSNDLPAGVSEGTVYFVRDAATDSLKLAATSGGAAIDLTGLGNGFLQRIIPETFGGQGTYTVNSATLDLNAVT